MLRLSVTDLESLRHYKGSDDANLEELLTDLAHVAPSTRQMSAGRALAKFFEHASDDTVNATEIEGWRFDFEMDASIRLPALREMKAEMEFATSVGPVVLVGKADGVDGITVRDQKLTEKFDIEEKYTDSLQWRAYLVMFKARRFIYDVFVGKYADGENQVTVREYHPVAFYSYPGIERDVEGAVNELAEVVVKYQTQIEALRAAHAAASAKGEAA